MTTAPTPQPEFSRPIAVDRLGEASVIKEIAATAEERDALARRFGLLRLDRLSADLRLERLPGKAVVRLSGRFTADVTQACVVSLEPVSSHLERDFAQLYTLFSDPEPHREYVIDVDAQEPPEALGPGGLDLGEAVVQQFALDLEPYPRAPDAKPPAAEDLAGPEAVQPDGPFAALKALKGRQ